MTIIKENQNTTKLIAELNSLVEKYPALNKKQERALIETYRNDRETLNKLLFNHNVRLVFTIAKKYVSKTNSFDDLVQNGFVGLAKATQWFDIDRDIKFITYASQWVRKYILSEIYGRVADLDRATFSMNTPISYSSSSKNDGDGSSTIENLIHDSIEPSMRAKDGNEECYAAECKDIYDTLTTSVSLSTELSANEKSMFTDLFYNQEKVKNIATKYNVDNKTVLAVKHKLIDYCKTVLREKLGIQSVKEIFA